MEKKRQDQQQNKNLIKTRQAAIPHNIQQQLRQQSIQQPT